jgi:hypothetical protein
LLKSVFQELISHHCKLVPKAANTAFGFTVAGVFGTGTVEQDGLTDEALT